MLLSLERSPSTNTSLSSMDADVPFRLQSLIERWFNAPRGQALTDLHNECLQIANRQSPLLPYRLLPVRTLDIEALRKAIRGYHLEPVFSITPTGSFDAALVASAHKGRFLFVFRDDIALKEQIGLYAHAVAHLLLNNYTTEARRRPHLRLQPGSTHIERLEELRYTDITPDVLDRDAMQQYPRLNLFESEVESPPAFNLATQDLRQRLKASGWDREQFVTIPCLYTDGRVIPESQRRGRRLVIDALLRLVPSLPVAVVYKQRAGEEAGQALGHVKAAAVRLAVPFAFLLDENNNLTQCDWLEGTPYPRCRPIAEFPSRDQLRTDWFAALMLTDFQAHDVLERAYRITDNKFPRYYQEAAINNALIAILQAQRGVRPPRLLITLATGTGKTMVAFQILWKLIQTMAIRRALFLADRTYLLQQAKLGDFAPFKDIIAYGKGQIDETHEIIFGSYQWLTQAGRLSETNFADYEPDYFDVIIIDECHRGSASENSQWRRVLDHFTSAIQVGLTATPLNSSSVRTHNYFGDPVYTYSLNRGISDGYLAPYRVRRVLIGTQDQANEAEREPEDESNENETIATGKMMRSYTPVIAKHLAEYMRQSDPRAKTIVFCVDNQHAADMRDALQQACASWARPGDIVRIVDDDGREGKNELDHFCDVDEPQPVIVTTSRLLSTGIDAPTCKNIVLARGVGSMVEFKQIIGRGTRLFSDRKSWFTILDYAGAIKHFHDANFDGTPDVISSEVLIPPPIVEMETESEDGIKTEEPGTGGQEDTDTTPKEPEEESTTLVGEQIQCSASPEHERESACVPPPVGADLEPTHAPSEPEPDRSEEIEFAIQPPPTPTKHVDEHTERPYQPEGQESSRDDTEMEQTGEIGEPVTELPSDVVMQEREDGHKIGVIGEYIYDQGPDGKLRRGTAQEFTARALQGFIKTPEDLRRQWCDDDQRKLIIEHLVDQIAPPEKLAQELQLENRDELDLLLYTLFQETPLTRQQRVERLLEMHKDFFHQFEGEELASEVLRVILEKYIRGEAPDVTDAGLIRLPPISERYRPGEIGQAFVSHGTSLKATLLELRKRLYSV